MVDDRPENLLALEAILQGLGHELIRASSGEEALKRLLTTDFAVILLDVQMPGMDGFETAAHIKRREKTRDIPILFLTAIDGEAHQAFRGYAAGAVDYLAKPFDPWVLRAKVGVFVELYEKRSELAAQADGLRRQLARYDSAGLERLSLEALRRVGAGPGAARATAAPGWPRRWRGRSARRARAAAGPARSCGSRPRPVTRRSHDAARPGPVSGRRAPDCAGRADGGRSRGDARRRAAAGERAGHERGRARRHRDRAAHRHRSRPGPHRGDRPRTRLCRSATATPTRRARTAAASSCSTPSRRSGAPGTSPAASRCGSCSAWPSASRRDRRRLRRRRPRRPPSPPVVSWLLGLPSDLEERLTPAQLIGELLHRLCGAMQLEQGWLLAESVGDTRAVVGRRRARPRRPAAPEADDGPPAGAGGRGPRRCRTAAVCSSCRCAVARACSAPSSSARRTASTRPAWPCHGWWATGWESSCATTAPTRRSCATGARWRCWPRPASCSPARWT